MTTTQQHTIGERVREARQAAGLSQRSLAESLTRLMGKPFLPTQVQRIEDGTRAVKADELAPMAQGLRVNVLVILGMMDPEQPTGAEAADIEAWALGLRADHATRSVEQSVAVVRAAQDALRAARDTLDADLSAFASSVGTFSLLAADAPPSPYMTNETTAREALERGRAALAEARAVLR